MAPKEHFCQLTVTQVPVGERKTVVAGHTDKVVNELKYPIYAPVAQELDVILWINNSDKHG